MKKVYKSFSLNITISLVYSLISSLAILPVMFLGEDESKNQIIKIIFPVIFWLCTVFELVFIFTANSIRKELESYPENKKFKRRIGVINFFSNKLAANVDFIFVISLLVFLVMSIFGLGEKVVQYILMFILILTFRVHCTLNGKNYRYKRYLRKRMAKKDV